MKSPEPRRLTYSRLVTAIGVSIVLLLSAFMLGVSFGSSSMGGLSFIGDLLTGRLSETDYTILVEARLPKIFLAAIVGAALSTSGAVLQAILRNPLADPYILGISGGAALGGTVFVVFGPMLIGIFAIGVPTAAFAGAVTALVFIFSVERLIPGRHPNNYVLLLTGVIFNAFASSIIMFLKSVVSPQKAQELLFYLMGSLSIQHTSYFEIWLSGGVVTVCVGVLLLYAHDLNILSLGYEEAKSLGVSVRKTRCVTVVVSSIAVAVAVAHSGLIGFVGLVVPHGVRLVTGPDHRILLPTCALLGAGFLILSDVLARQSFVLFQTTLPVGVITSMLGAPLFIFFLWRSFQNNRLP
jgi:iron complex transport system permease protein